MVVSKTPSPYIAKATLTPSLLLTRPGPLPVKMCLNSPSLTVMRKIVFLLSCILGKKNHKWKSGHLCYLWGDLGYFFLYI